jgi:hypothetical protein
VSHHDAGMTFGIQIISKIIRNLGRGNTSKDMEVANKRIIPIPSSLEWIHGRNNLSQDVIEKIIGKIHRFIPKVRRWVFIL